MRLPIYFTLLILTQQGAMRKRTILLEKQEGECLFQRKNSVQAYIHTCERDSFVNEIVIQHLEKYYFAAASFSCKLSNAGFFCHRSYFPHSCRKSPFKRQSVSVCGVCVWGGEIIYILSLQIDLNFQNLDFRQVLENEQECVHDNINNNIKT